MEPKLTFEQFRQQWIEEIQSGPNPLDRSRRFAWKLFTQWRDISTASDDLIVVDGAYDGGIDLAYLERGESTDESSVGDTWYVVQCKYEASPINRVGLLAESQKIISSLASGDSKTNEAVSNLIARISQFRRKADSGENGDRLILVFLTDRSLSPDLRSVLEDIRTLGKERIGPIFDVTAVSLETVWVNTLEDPIADDLPGTKVHLSARLTSSGENLLIGLVKLPDLYEFLKQYRTETEDLDQIYEKNVRRFLGGRRRVNKGIHTTLVESPDQFGLYNNGITIAVKRFEVVGEDKYELTEPYIVNGCQTTRSIWEVFLQKLDSGGVAEDPELETWRGKAESGVVVTKIVRVGRGADNLLQNVTRYTNSQNAVSEKDFLTLDSGFQRWKVEMAEKYGIFLEIQRGGWDSQQALQNQNPSVRKFYHYANAFDLLKVYGAGWLREAGTSFGRNAAFFPGGPLYRRITEEGPEGTYGVEDLYAAYLLQIAANQLEFGRGSKWPSRRQTRYLFYLIAIDFMKDVLIRSNLRSGLKDITRAVIAVLGGQNLDARQEFVNAAVGVIDEYLNRAEEDSVFKEPSFQDDLNAFLKSDDLGKQEQCPNLHTLLAINKRTLGRGHPSPREMIAEVAKSACPSA